jgi:hypothetical protein
MIFFVIRIYILVIACVFMLFDCLMLSCYVTKVMVEEGGGGRERERERGGGGRCRETFKLFSLFKKTQVQNRV